jgi:hypothetical protein
MARSRKPSPVSHLEHMCAGAVKLLRARGHGEVAVLIEPLDVLQRFGVSKRTLDFERAGNVQHILFVIGGHKDILVRFADYLPIWREKCPTVHVEARGEVWLTGTCSGEFIPLLAECLHSALAKVRAPLPSTSAQPARIPATSKRPRFSLAR